MITLSDVQIRSTVQKASIFVDAVLLFYDAVGIIEFVSESAVRAAVKDTVEILQNSTQLQRVILAFITAWDKAKESGSATEKVHALVVFLKDSNVAGILWTIISSLCQEMTWVDWLKAAAKVLLMLISLLATDGAALIARIGLFAIAAHDFEKKLLNMA